MGDFFSALPRGRSTPIEAPSQPSPRGRSRPKHPQTQREWTPAPWGGMGRGFWAGDAPPLPLNHLLAIADIDAGRQRVPVLRHLDALQRVDALLAGGHVGVYGADSVGGGLYD